MVIEWGEFDGGNWIVLLSLGSLLFCGIGFISFGMLCIVFEVEYLFCLVLVFCGGMFMMMWEIWW